MPPSERLGPYLIQRPLGSGGMGTVFLGVDETTGKRAAIKVLSPALGGDASFRERFATEIETLKKLEHPNIVQLLGFGEQDGQLFYAMEMVDGRSLQQELRSGRHFSWREVARIGIQVCQALKHAHDRGVIHRDLKPANLLYATDDQIKLADFGIAKLYGMSQLTVAGGVMKRRLHVAGRARGRESQRAATCTAWGVCSTRCWRAGRRSPPARQRKSSTGFATRTRCRSAAWPPTRQRSSN